MVAKKRGLGRGLDALLSDVAAQDSPYADQAEGEQVATQGDLRQMPLEDIQRGRYQPRRDLEPQALEELASSIRAQGVMQPIVVRPIDG